MVRACGALSTFLSLPITLPLGFFAALWLSASRSNWRYSVGLASPSGSHPTSPGMEPSSQDGRTAPGYHNCSRVKRTILVSHLLPLFRSFDRSGLSLEFISCNEAHASAREFQNHPHAPLLACARFSSARQPFWPEQPSSPGRSSSRRSSSPEPSS